MMICVYIQYDNIILFIYTYIHDNSRCMRYVHTHTHTHTHIRAYIYVYRKLLFISHSFSLCLYPPSILYAYY